ncbi:hypothetical protein N7466_006971 [Penicillium verhagenii]|uniref:uncharacterized protein n=1 Tax=Penicillium verhagenii TaxID=1562060 RepID=UPI002545A9A9|nr:uncharacterized protein N7466_006971 [Penicillium verhagenii]KAJ5928015.1 hypothetical protein N7466_006971 [Penicillium verhagenii]
MNRQNRYSGHNGIRPSHPRVPPSRSINHGTPVNIVLKADQPTGRTVPGTVGELLSHGDHPRGVKVRLTDGRVGRVQSLRGVDELSDSTHEEVNRMAEGIPKRTEGCDNTIGRRSYFATSDMRLGRGEEPTSEPIGLDMYIRPPKGKKQVKKTQLNLEERDGGLLDTASAPRTAAASILCPVCGIFEGDEAAVSYHVTRHFEEG